MEDEPGSENEGDTMVASPLAKWRIEFSRSFQNHLDRSAPHLIRRWLVTLVAAVIYIYRVDPEIEALDPTSLPRDDSDEFKPFVRRLPEFKFWYAATKAFVVAFVMTFFSFLDVPVFWPILLCYWLFLYFLTMKRQIVHMFKYRYFPFDIRKKKRHGGNDKPSSSNALERDEKPAPM
ncbi:Protein RER1D [Cardamine amara subsp. amara]|uniref:Protein RER1 n=1 Tax=Cardamine amara subsp. amara TaxID=228776 RepID=A0ABD0ZY34_CARAN